MKNLIYLSPVPWASFAQRPHKFVSWFQKKYGGRVLWLEPYATRFPSLSDLRRVKTNNSGLSSASQNPAWLTVVSPGGLPIEPFPGSKLFNNFVWRTTLMKSISFAAEEECTLVIGKPSVLALEILKALPHCKALYDAMDDFSAFYSGFSQSAMKRREVSIAMNVDDIWASSTLLYRRWENIHKNVQLVYNGIDADIIQRVTATPSINGSRRIFGYIGTIGKWFDWDLVIALARAVPNDLVRIIGPVFKLAPETLPANVELLPPCDHEQALAQMTRFDVGLIPFLRNKLTRSVDPIKYYEYRAFGIPVISTDFGEMCFRGDSEGVHLVSDGADLERVILLACRDNKERKLDHSFAELNSWANRFNQTGL